MVSVTFIALNYTWWLSLDAQIECESGAVKDDNTNSKPFIAGDGQQESVSE